ncbi:hypothetical protein [Butyrivibrio sp. AE3003]|uniref:hypothetical protein n=1 Tax=Butyrivibrio sp. AE3003 TaxID=1496721 RepID=UPI00047E9174|nr:hypothetical protein [Butyrivibrio sp. AE3003]
MTRHTVKKSRAIRTVMSLTLASTIFLTSGIGAAVAHAGGKEGVHINNTSGVASINDFKKLVEEGKDMSDKTVILSTNDAQCNFDKYPYVASLKNFFEDSLKSDVVLIDTGDFCEGKDMEKFWSANGGAQCMNTYDNDYAAFLAMNEAGYDFANFGNYGFNYGSDINTNNYFDSGCSIVNFDCADKAMNAACKGKGKDFSQSSDCFSSIMKQNSLCDNSFMYDCANSDMKIGFFGLPEYEALGNYDLSKNSEWYTCAEQQAQSLKEDGADLVICMSQLGLGDALKGGSGIFNLLGNLFGLGGKSASKGASKGGSGMDFIDLLLDGCSLFAEGESALPLKLADMLLRNIGVTILDNNSKSIEDNFLFSLDDIIKNLGGDSNISKFVSDMIGGFGFNLFGDADCDFDCDWDWDYNSCTGKTNGKSTPQPKPSPQPKCGDTPQPQPKPSPQPKPTPQPKGGTSTPKPDGAAAPKGETVPAKPDGAAAPKGETVPAKPDGAAAPKAETVPAKPDGAPAPQYQQNSKSLFDELFPEEEDDDFFWF